MESEYKATIGLEVHAELNTRSKMFCGSKNDASEDRPNVNVCPVCMAHPGTLPVINHDAVRHVLRVGLALGSTLADYTEFDRKNYFYPDLPKGYQLSQFEYPLVSGGELCGVAITRIHLEEDTASSTHNDATGATLIDYNRAGVPLMELVTEPVLHSPEEAARFGEELQLLLRTLGASDADMEKGQMRLEANVSVSNTQELGTKVEIKNINSFRAMERAAAYEIRRQIEVLKSGGTVVQETRGWDDAKQSTFSQRVKEGSADYRYFPDPDLPSLRISECREFSVDSLGEGMPELPWEKRKRYIDSGVKAEDAESFTRDPRFGSFFDAVGSVVAGAPELIAIAANYTANDLVKVVRDIEVRDAKSLESVPMSAEYFGKLIRLVAGKKISSRSAKDILILLVTDPRDPETIAKEKGLFQEIDMQKLETVAAGVIERAPEVVAEYKAGKVPALEYFVGQCMKELRGAADAAAIRDILRKLLALRA